MKPDTKKIIKQARDLHKDVDIEALLDKVCKENNLCQVCRTEKLKHKQEFCKKCKSHIKEISREFLEDQEDA